MWIHVLDRRQVEQLESGALAATIMCRIITLLSRVMARPVPRIIARRVPGNGTEFRANPMLAQMRLFCSNKGLARQSTLYE